MTEWAIYALATYGLIDFILSMLLGRCVLPGLKCRACKEKQDAN